MQDGIFGVKFFPRCPEEFAGPQAGQGKKLQCRPIGREKRRVS